MSVQTELDRLASAKEALVRSIAAKGVSVPAGTTLDSFSRYVENIPQLELPVLTAPGSAADLLAGKELIGQQGEKITGTIPSQAAATVTPGTASKIAVPAGRYTAGAVTVAGDSHLTADNIKSGVSIFGVAGTFKGDTWLEIRENVRLNDAAEVLLLGNGSAGGGEWSESSHPFSDSVVTAVAVWMDGAMAKCICLSAAEGISQYFSSSQAINNGLTNDTIRYDSTQNANVYWMLSSDPLFGVSNQVTLYIVRK